MPRISEIWKTLVRAINEFIADDCVTMAAALAYYAVFSLPPLLFLIASVAGGLLGWDRVEAQLFQNIQQMTGPGVASHLRDELHAVAQRLKPDSGTIIGAGAFLLFAATGVLVQLQNAINRAWAVRPDPKRGFVRNFLAKRMLSLGMVLVLSAVMFGLVAVSTLISTAGESITWRLPPPFSEPVVHMVDLISGFVIFFVFFSAVFRIMPDAEVEWRDVWIGAGVTAGLLSIGRLGVALYLGARDLAETFGPAAALAVLLLWVYYSAMIVLFGAEFTHCWASRRGRRIVPAQGAVAVIKARIDEPEAIAEENLRA